eukprot:1386044-Amorphochlora_amoeboformis.AAC.2
MFSPEIRHAEFFRQKSGPVWGCPACLGEHQRIGMSTAGNAASVSPPLPVTSHAKIPRAFSQSAKPWTFTLPNAATPVGQITFRSSDNPPPLPFLST